MTNAKLLVVADDFTGGLDTGVQFARQGVATRIVVNPDGTGDWTETDVQVLVAIAESRHLSPKAAYATVFRIVAEARRAGIPYIYKKTDSALRGNIGSELSAALAASDADMLPFLPAFPRLRRTTAGGAIRSPPPAPGRRSPSIPRPPPDSPRSAWRCPAGRTARPYPDLR